MKKFISLLIILVLGFYLYKGISKLKFGVERKGVYKYYNENGVKDTGVSNIVTSIVLTYRGFDTLGEVTILFLASLGVGALMYGRKEKLIKEECFIIDTGYRVLFPAMILYGIYIFLHGHLTPGGGFQGGAIIATAMLYRMVVVDKSMNEKFANFLEGLSGISFVILGLIGLIIVGSFLANKEVLSPGVVKNLVSAGIIPLIYIAIGVKVGFELTGILNKLKSEE